MNYLITWGVEFEVEGLGQQGACRAVEVALGLTPGTLHPAAYHAGQAVGFFGDSEELAKAWSPARIFEPKMSETEREARYGGWLEAVARVKSNGAV